MVIEKKSLPNFKVYSPFIGDTKKQWFVYWVSDTGRKKKYGNINSFTTYDGRMKAAKELIRQLTKELADTPTYIETAIWKEFDKEAPQYRKKTFLTYKSKLKMFFDFARGKEINRVLVVSFFDKIKSTRSNATYNKYYELLKFYFGRVGVPHLMEGLKRLKLNYTPARYFQQHQINQLKAYLETNDKELLLFIKFMYYTFARPGELRLMRLSDILFDENKILFRGEISKNKKTQYVTIPLAFQKDKDFLALKNRGANELIFPSKLGKPYGVNTFSTRHRVIMRKLNFGKAYSLYSWKHTGAVAAAKAGVSLKELQIQLRHHSLDMVDRYLRQLGVYDLINLEKEFPKL